MKRREAISLLSGAAVAGWIQVSALSPVRAVGKIARVGSLTLSASAEMSSRLAEFRDGMHELGYLEGYRLRGPICGRQS
jgi:hypothetical protein